MGRIDPRRLFPKVAEAAAEASAAPGVAIPSSTPAPATPAAPVKAVADAAAASSTEAGFNPKEIATAIRGFRENMGEFRGVARDVVGISKDFRELREEFRALGWIKDDKDDEAASSREEWIEPPKGPQAPQKPRYKGTQAPPDDDSARSADSAPPETEAEKALREECTLLARKVPALALREFALISVVPLLEGHELTSLSDYVVDNMDAIAAAVHQVPDEKVHDLAAQLVAGRPASDLRIVRGMLKRMIDPDANVDDEPPSPPAADDVHVDDVQDAAGETAPPPAKKPRKKPAKKAARKKPAKKSSRRKKS